LAVTSWCTACPAAVTGVLRTAMQAAWPGAGSAHERLSWCPAIWGVAVGEATLTAGTITAAGPMIAAVNRVNRTDRRMLAAFTWWAPQGKCAHHPVAGARWQRSRAENGRDLALPEPCLALLRAP